MSHCIVGEFHSVDGRNLKILQFHVFGRKTHLFETVNRKKNFYGMLDMQFQQRNQALTAKKLSFDLRFYQSDERVDLKSTVNSRSSSVILQCF